MRTRVLAIILATLALFLSASWWARNYFAGQNCEEKGLLYEPGRGCVEPPKAPQIILERGLKRT